MGQQKGEHMVLDMVKTSDVKKVQLEQLSAEVSELVPNDLMLTMEDAVMVPRHLLFTLQGWMWAQRPERKIIGTAWTRVPKTWWDHLKMTVVNRVPQLGKWIDWEWKEIYRNIEVDLQVAYPDLRVLAPNHGNHLIIAQMVDEKEARDGQYYWRWEYDEVGSDAK